MRLWHRLAVATGLATVLLGTGSAVIGGGLEGAHALPVPNTYTCVPSPDPANVCIGTFGLSGSEGAFVVVNQGTQTGLQVECDLPGAVTVLTIESGTSNETSLPILPFCP